jgi:thiamine-monophosphate kinase
MPGEFALIARIQARAAGRDDVVLGIGDDAALLRPSPGQQLVVATDTLNAGVHFPADSAPADVGWKALAVNLSDLAAMGAEPAWCTLSLSLPGAQEAWLDGFLDGFLELADAHGVALVGGDTTRGPLSICVTAIGAIAEGAALRRDGARIDDEIWVTGTLGDASAALAQWRRGGGDCDGELRLRLDRPTPRVAVGRALCGLASACIDISDGLGADLGHVLRASRVGAEIDVATLPASPALATAFDTMARIQHQVSGGDDYELCFTAEPGCRGSIQAAMAACGARVTRIGRIVAPTGLRLIAADGSTLPPGRAGYEHFGEGPQ